IGLGMSALDYAQRAIADVHFAGLAVQFKKERASAVGMRLADGQKLDDEGFSGFDFDGDLFARLQAIEKCGGGQNADIRIGLAKFVVLGEDVGIEQIAQQTVAAYRVTEFFLEGLVLVIPFYRLQVCAGTATQRDLATEDNFLQLFGPAARRSTEN